MNNQLILIYLSEHPAGSLSELENVYAYLKFKAYLQTTLRLTKKAYGIKKMKDQTISTDMDELTRIADQRYERETEMPYDIEWALSLLEPEHAELLRLIYYDGKTDEEISRTNRVSRQAINAKRHRALNKLRRLLENAND